MLKFRRKKEIISYEVHQKQVECILINKKKKEEKFKKKTDTSIQIQQKEKENESKSIAFIS